MNDLPLITICELHVHCVTAEEGLGVQRELDVGRVRDGVTDQNQVRDSRLRLPIRTGLSEVLIHTHVSRAVQHLDKEQDQETGTALGQIGSVPVVTFHVADFTLTVRPLLVRVHFIRRKKLLSVFGSLAFLEPEITRQ